MAFQTGIRLTASEYYALPEYGDHDLIQLIDGTVIIGMPPTLRHQTIVSEILFVLMTYARQHGGKALTAPTSAGCNSSKHPISTTQKIPLNRIITVPLTVCDSKHVKDYTN